MTKLIYLISVILLVGCMTTTKKADLEKEKLQGIFDTYIVDYFNMNPVSATQFGAEGYNHLFKNYLSAEYRVEEKQFFSKYLRKLDSIDGSVLSNEDQLNIRLLHAECERHIEWLNYPTHILSINQKYSIPLYFPLLTSVMPFNSVKDYENYLARLKKFSPIMDTAIDNLKQGVESGIVQPKVITEKSLRAIKSQMVDNAKESILFNPLKSWPDSLPDTDKQRLSSEVISCLEMEVFPAYQRMINYVEETYLNASRESISISELPNGKEWYNYAIKYHTTTNFTADEIYEIGLSEVDRIKTEIDSIRQLVKYEGDLQSFFNFLRNDPQFYYSSGEEVLAAYDDIRKVVEVKIPEYFKVLPKADFEIRPVEAYRAASAAGGSLSPATADGSRPSIFYVNTHNLDRCPSFELTDLFLHEAVPGHHLQIALQQEQEYLPVFRQISWFTAYGEGWALYAEELGKEMGVLNDPYQYYGKLSGELFRAIRLVVDVGIHAKDWSRQEVIDYMLENSSFSLADIESEVDRYIVWPGQALAYKIGELKIKELRAKAEEKLGDKFDIKEFHHTVLKSGTIPLDILESIVDDWIESLI